MRKLKYVDLIFYRLVPQLVRPLVVLFEGIYCNSNLLVSIISLNSLLIISTAVPCHIDFFKKEKLKNLTSYISSIVQIIIFSLILSFLLYFTLFEQNILLAVISSLLFLIDKLVDELARYNELHKRYLKWFYLQFAKAAWPIFGMILFYFEYLEYNHAIFLVSFIVLIPLLYTFQSEFKIKLRDYNNTEGLLNIKDKITLTIGSFIPSVLLTGPRLFVSSFFPNIAHYFFVATQLANTFNLMYNIKFSIPYRRIIAIKPYKYVKIIFGNTVTIMHFTFIIALISYLLFEYNLDEVSNNHDVVIFTPILIINAFLVAHFLNLVSVLHWVKATDRIKTYVTYGFTFLLFVIGTTLAVYFNKWYLPTFLSILISYALTYFTKWYLFNAK